MLDFLVMLTMVISRQIPSVQPKVIYEGTTPALLLTGLGFFSIRFNKNYSMWVLRYGSSLYGAVV